MPEDPHFGWVAGSPDAEHVAGPEPSDPDGVLEGPPAAQKIPDNMVWVADWHIGFNDSGHANEHVTAMRLVPPTGGEDGWGTPQGYKLIDMRPGTREEFIVAYFDQHSVRAIVSDKWRQEPR